MGRSGFSSKRKYTKKKSLKLSSEAHRKKKSRRNESKKLCHHDNSFLSSSDNESTSSSVFSSSSSEGEYKSKRSRSRARSAVKGSKKRTRRRSLSEDSSGKASPPAKKRKRSKKKGDERKKKKNKKIKKKKSRRDTYISSASSDSESCSTCKDDGDCSSDEGASRMRSRGRSREKKKDHRDSKKGKSGSRKKRSRTRSSSPSNSYDDESVEKVMVENNSRRLKSVITVVKPLENEEDDMKRDELKEEIVYDNDDYPSCKSNDSNELVDLSNVSPEKKILTSVIGEVNSASSLNDSKEKKSNTSGNTGSEVDKLELILRQRALENLSKFRGGTKPKTVVSVDDKHSSDQSGIEQLTTISVDLGQTQNRLPAQEQDGFSMKPMSQPVVPRNRFTWRRDPSVTTGKVEKAVTHSGLHTSELQPVAPKLQSAHLSSRSIVENKTNEEKASTYSGPLPSASRPAALKLQSTHLSPTSRVGKKTVNEMSEIMVNTDNTSGDTETKVDQKSIATLETSASASSTKEGSSKEQPNETTDNSQFEKKTMSVMRGGEMVQVSYKVYIPTRAPALARRQLKR